MIELKNEQIVIDGQPRLLLCGEIHYFRLPKEDWEDRLIKLKTAGANTVATYIPWVCHEPSQGEFDFTGKLDLAAFISLCEKHELYFIARPGPFIMAEMVNEGIPYWVYEKYPEAIPVGWDNQAATTPTLDYLSENFLHAAKAWYQKIAEIIVPHLYQNKGAIIAFQLDNEIGMLSWVSNVPDLTDEMIRDFYKWLTRKYGVNLSQLYPIGNEIMQDSFLWVRAPQEEYAGQLKVDLGHYLRFRYKEYVRILKEFAIEDGISEIPFIVNIHGTGGGRGFTYPIGISQLYESYTQASDFLPGSDIYFGDFTMEMVQDLYLSNAFMKAVNRPGQPISSMEFNCGDGNFGDNYGGRYDISAADLKGRLCLAQGNRLLNYYLFSGGFNDELPMKHKNGNNRIAVTGERHGFAAPISPEGEINYTFQRMSESMKTFRGNQAHLAEMVEELDDVRFGFIPDYYMTEFCYPKSQKMKAINQNIERFRGPSAWEIVARSMLLATYRFGAIDIQNKELRPEETPVLVLPLAEYLSVSLQMKLVEYIEAGGKLFVYGNLPRFDDLGNDCSIMTDALGLRYLDHIYDEPGVALSVEGVGWAKETPEIRTSHAQLFSLTQGTIFLREKETQGTCGAQLLLGKGSVIFLTSDYRGNKEFFLSLFSQFSALPQLTHDYQNHGIILTSSIARNSRGIHLMNLDGFVKEFRIYEAGTPLFENQAITLGARRGLILPINYETLVGRIHYATGEIAEQSEDTLILRTFGKQLVIKLETDRQLIEESHMDVTAIGKSVIIQANPVDELVSLTFSPKNGSDK